MWKTSSGYLLFLLFVLLQLYHSQIISDLLFFQIEWEFRRTFLRASHFPQGWLVLMRYLNQLECKYQMENQIMAKDLIYL